MVAVTAAADVTLRATGLVTFPLLARRAGADGYGAYTQINHIAAFVVPFASLGLSGAMVRFFATRPWGPEARRDVMRLVLAVVISATALASLFFVGAGWLNSAVLGWPDGDRLFRVSAGLIVVGAVEQVALNLLWARDRLYAYSGYKVAQALVLIGALLGTLRGPEDLVRAVAALGIGRAAIACGAIVLVLRSAHIENAIDVDSPKILAMVRYGFPLAVSAIGLWIINLADRVVIGHYRPPEDLGRYGSVYTIAGLVAISTGPLLLPALGRLMRATAAGQHDIVRSDVALFHRYIAIGAIGCAVGLGVLIQPVVRLVGGQDFAVSGGLVAMVVIGLFIDQWNGLAHYILLCNDRTSLLQNAWLGAGLFNVVANVVAVPKWGVDGAAAMTLVTFLILNVVLYKAASGYVPLRRTYGWSTSARALTAGTVAGLPVLLMTGPGVGLANLVGGAAIFGLGYLAVLALLRELKPDDVRMLRDLLPGRPEVIAAGAPPKV